jgi:hypothetical protein
MIDEAQERLDSELDIIKVIQNLRNMHILLKSKLMDEDIEFQIAHSQKNFIDLDESLHSDDEGADTAKGDAPTQPKSGKNIFRVQ